MSSVLPSPLTPGPSPLADSSLAALQRWKSLNWRTKLLIRWRILAAKLIKSELWETLAIIGATQLVVLPWIGCRFAVRFAVMALLGAAHCLLSYWFNWDFLYGVPGNWMSRAWMTGTDRGWDGGVFGPVCWAVVMLGGTLAYDLVTASASRPRAAARLAVWGCGFLAVGYSLSCLTRLYELSGTELAEMRHRHVRQDAQRASLDEAITRQRTALKSLEDSAPHDAARDEKIEQIEAQILRSKTNGDNCQISRRRKVPCCLPGNASADGRSPICCPNSPSSRLPPTIPGPIRLRTSSTGCGITGCWGNGCPISHS